MFHKPKPRFPDPYRSSGLRATPHPERCPNKGPRQRQQGNEKQEHCMCTSPDSEYVSTKRLHFTSVLRIPSLTFNQGFSTKFSTGFEVRDGPSCGDSN